MKVVGEGDKAQHIALAGGWLQVGEMLRREAGRRVVERVASPLAPAVACELLA